MLPKGAKQPQSPWIKACQDRFWTDLGRRPSILHLEEALPKPSALGLAPSWMAESDPGHPMRLDADNRHLPWSALLTTLARSPCSIFRHSHRLSWPVVHRPWALQASSLVQCGSSPPTAPPRTRPKAQRDRQKARRTCPRPLLAHRRKISIMPSKQSPRPDVG
ncbi:hypothetical protein VTN02DRAFT_2871 [Thermoascus thermophilus]